MFDPKLVQADYIKLDQDSYIGDIHTGSSQLNVNHMIGNLCESSQFSDIISTFSNYMGLLKI